MRSIFQAGSTRDSSARRSISSPALGALAFPLGTVSFKQGALEIRQQVWDRRISGLSPPHACCIVSSHFCVGHRVFCGPILFGRCYSLALLQWFLILLLYLIHAATTLRIVAISLSLAATTIKSLQYNNHIATPLVCVAISKLPFPTTRYASQHLCFLLQWLNFVLP